MFKLCFSMFAGLATGALALTPTAADAAGHGGSFHARGFRGGACYGGAFHHGWYGHGYGYGGWGWGGGPYYGGSGWDIGYGYPWNAGYVYVPSSYYSDTAPHYGTSPASYYDYSLGKAVRQDDASATGSSYSYGATAQAPLSIPSAVNAARIRVIVPKDAQVWVEGTPTRQSGTVRQFLSPPLTVGKQYTYNILAKWIEAGREITQTRSLPVWPNSSTTVDFTGADMNLD
jgi:uncharacterized protein (TIGR03000 family)